MPEARRRPYGSAPLPLLLALGLAPLWAACAGGAQQRAGLARSSPNVTMTTPELRIRASLFAEDFGARVEAAADSIMARSPDAEIRRRALMWKASAIPTIQQSMFISDPLAALIDGWTFAVQMDAYLTVGAGSDAFGEWQPIAVAASAYLVGRAEELARLAATDEGFENGTEFVTRWAREHRLESLTFARQHTAAEWAAEIGVGARGGLAAAADINESITAISNRLSIYAAALPKQARWQAELLLWDVLDEPPTQAFLDDVAAIRVDVDSISTQFAEIRDVFIELDGILTGQRRAAFADVDARFTAMLERLTREQGALDSLLAVQRAAVFEDISGQRAAAMAELDSVVQRAVRTALADSTDVIDHMVLRVVQLLAGLVLVVLIVWLVLRRRRRPA